MVLIGVIIGFMLLAAMGLYLKVDKQQEEEELEEWKQNGHPQEGKWVSKQ